MSKSSRINLNYSPNCNIAEMRLLMAIFTNSEDMSEWESYALEVLWNGAIKSAQSLVRERFKEIIFKAKKERKKKRESRFKKFMGGK